MGARPKTVWRRLYEGRKSLWALSHCGPVDHALSKTYFAERGLLVLERAYRKVHPSIAPVQLELTLG